MVHIVAPGADQKTGHSALAMLWPLCMIVNAYCKFAFRGQSYQFSVRAINKT